MNTYVEIGFSVGLLLCFDVVAVVYLLRILDAAPDQYKTRIVLTLFCIAIIVNTTSIGFIASLQH